MLTFQGKILNVLKILKHYGYCSLIHDYQNWDETCVSFLIEMKAKV